MGDAAELSVMVTAPPATSEGQEGGSPTMVLVPAAAPASQTPSGDEAEPAPEGGGSAASPAAEAVDEAAGGAGLAGDEGEGRAEPSGGAGLNQADPYPTEAQWSPKLAKAIEDNGLEEVFTALGPALLAQFGTSTITHAMLTHHRVRVAGDDGYFKNVTISLVNGEDRYDAVQAWVSELMPNIAAGTRVTPYALATSLFAVLNELAPPPPTRGAGRRLRFDDDEDDDRSSSPSLHTRLAVARAEAAEKAKESMHEMSAQEISDRFIFMARKPGKAPSQSNVCHANQLKRMHEELVKLKRVPCGHNTQPLTMKCMAGEGGLLSAKTERGKEVHAEETKAPLELRWRLRIYATSVRLVTCYEDDAEETSKGVTAFLDAVDDCTHLTTYAQVRAA